MELIVYLIFAFSGAAGLMYESVWARYLGLFVGHAAYAQVLVLGIFLGGMALGALIVGARTARIRDPLRAYALVELAAGLMGLVFHDVFVAVTGWAYAFVLPAAGDGALGTGVQWTIAALLLLPQSLLLGATFPLLAAGVLRRTRHPAGAVLARLYCANGLGAAAGVLLAGFWLLGAAGLAGTVVAAGTVNLVVGLASLAVARQVPLTDSTAPDDEPVASSAERAPARLTAVLLLVSFGTAAASFTYEIAWIRMLSLTLGSATHVFELMLSAFILGLALGAFWVRQRLDRWEDPIRALALVQWLMGAAALATLPTFGASFAWTSWLFEVLGRTEAGYSAFNAVRYGIALAIMLPSTFFAGITFPLITRTLYLGGVGERAVGTVYGANTLGSIAGAGLAGLVLMPLLGVQWLLAAGAVADMAIGVAIVVALLPGQRRWSIGFAVGAAAMLAWAFSVGRVGETTLASGVFRHGDRDALADAEMVFHEDGRTATVSVYRDGDLLTVATNGKPDGSLPMGWIVPDRCVMGPDTASLRADQATQILAPLLTLAHAPPGAQVAVIGHGTGMSAHAVLADSSVAGVVTVEIEPAMIEGSRAFYPANRRVFDDPRSTFVSGDARAYFARSDTDFDVVFSEPSNPWVSGVASLFTAEFYAHVRERLRDGGVFGQWLHLYELNDGLVLTVLSALDQAFDDFALFATSPGDILVVATRGDGHAPDWERLERIFAGPDGCGLRRPDQDELRALQLADRGLFAPLLASSVAPNSDFVPVLDLGAQRTFFTKEFAGGIYGLATTRFDLSAALSGRRYAPLLGVAPLVAGHPRLVPLHQGWYVAREIAGPFADAPPAYRAARHAWHGWRARVAVAVAPDDWGAWIVEFQSVLGDRAGGTAGWYDTQLFDVTDRYLGMVAPPSWVRATVDLHRALQRGDYGALAGAADAVIEAGGQAHDVLDAELVLEAAVLAHLQRGDPERALAVHDRFVERFDVDRAALRYQLLRAVLMERARR